MTNKQLSKIRTKLLSIGLIFISIALVSCGQTRQEKTIVIIKKLNLIENQKQSYEFQLEPLKNQARGNDSIKILELEKQLSEDEIIKKFSSALNESFSEDEINDIYNFIQSSAFEKFFNSNETNKIIASRFQDIDKEIEVITNSFSKIVEKPTKKFEPIPVDKEDGFYATIDNSYSTEDKDIKLENNPSLTSTDILEIKKVNNKYNDNRPEISIVLTKEGARKFYLLTKENIRKPIAIVIDKKIVSIPIIQTVIMEGKARISGDFTEKEIDKMIEKLKNDLIN